MTGQNRPPGSERFVDIGYDSISAGAITMTLNDYFDIKRRDEQVVVTGTPTHKS